MTKESRGQRTTFHLGGYLFIYSGGGAGKKNMNLTMKQGCVLILFPDQITARGTRYHQHDYLGGTETGSFIK